MAVYIQSWSSLQPHSSLLSQSTTKAVIPTKYTTSTFSAKFTTTFPQNILQQHLINWCSNSVSYHPFGFQRREFPEVGVEAILLLTFMYQKYDPLVVTHISGKQTSSRLVSYLFVWSCN
jgi:hypothetical protein